jgi:hypothetical protein
MAKRILDRMVLEAALVGLQARRSHIDARMADVRAQLTGTTTAAAPAKRRKRRL